MIQNKLENILKERNISIKRLSEKLIIRYPTIHDLVKCKTKSINYELLNKICKELNVTPGDILKYIPDEEKED